jgi:hypothetical protein
MELFPGSKPWAEGYSPFGAPIFQSSRTPVVGLSLGPAKRNPVLVGLSYFFVDISAKFFRIIGRGTDIELAFIDNKSRWIAVLQFAFAQVISAEGSILRNISANTPINRRTISWNRR